MLVAVIQIRFCQVHRIPDPYPVESVPWLRDRALVQEPEGRYCTVSRHNGRNLFSFKQWLGVQTEFRYVGIFTESSNDHDAEMIERKTQRS